MPDALPLIPTVVSLIAIAGLIVVEVSSRIRSRKLFASWISPVLVVAAGMSDAVIIGWLIAAGTWLLAGMPLPAVFLLIASTGMALLHRPHRPTPALADAPGLKVMTVNVLSVNSDRAQSIAAEIRTEQPNIVLIQEYSTRNAEALEQLADTYPYQFVSDHPVIDDVADLAIFSRHPLENMRLEYVAEDRPVLLAELVWHGRTITVASVHTRSPTDRSRAAEWVDEFVGFRGLVEGIDTPLLIAGDYNAVNDHAPFRDMLTATGLQDVTAGVHTWPNYRLMPAFWQLDHVLASAHWRIIGSARPGIGTGSDHKPLLVTVKLT